MTITVPDADGVVLEAHLAVPPTQGEGRPGVVFCHGFPSGQVSARIVGGDLSELAEGTFRPVISDQGVEVVFVRRGTGRVELLAPTHPESPVARFIERRGAGLHHLCYAVPDLATARHYPGLCLFEGTSLSVGRGTDHPFQQVGGPGLDGVGLAARMNALGLPGVRFEAVRFTPRAPTDGKWAETELEGVRLVETEPERYDPTRTAVALLLEARRAASRMKASSDARPLLRVGDRCLASPMSAMYDGSVSTISCALRPE